MLPKDAKWWCEEAAADMQSTLDPHLRPKETIAAYLESSFHAVAIQWLVETDQVSISITRFE